MSPTRILKSIVPPFLWSIGSSVKRRVVRSTTLLKYAPRGWATPLPGGVSSDQFRTQSIALEQAHCEELLARIEAREPMLYADSDENSKYAVFGLCAGARDAGPAEDYRARLRRQRRRLLLARP